MFKQLICSRSSGFQGLRALLVALLLGLFAAFAAHADDDFLDPEVAFKFSSTEKTGEVEIHFAIADGYYMYRERFAFAVKQGQATLGEPQLPGGHIKFDETFNKNVETYRGALVVRVPISRASGPFDLEVTSQGCADKGICYPPAQHIVHVSGAALVPAVAGNTTTAQPGQANANDAATRPGQANVNGAATHPGQVDTHGEATAPTDQGGQGALSNPSAANAAPPFLDRFFSADYAQSILQHGGLFGILGFFFAGGVVLSLFPCSLPMIPILSSIIVGEGAQVTRVRGFTLSVAYVLGMALVFAALGVAAAAIGQSLGGWLQNPWVLGIFAVLIAALACVLLAGRDLQLPARLQNQLNSISQRQAGGKFVAVFVMGALSAVVVGACMTAPLAAILLFIAHTGSVALGATALFAMGVGNGVPLLIVGLGAGALLPRAGVWMDGVKRFFGMMLLAVAFWLVTPVMPITLSMLLGALWLLFAAALLHLFDRSAAPTSVWWRFGKGLGAALAVWAVALVAGVAAGSSDPLKPLAVFAGAQSGGAQAANAEPAFARVKSSAELDRALRAGQRVAMLDFYADWCTSCKEMEKLTFTDPRVRARMASMDLLRADVTANNSDDQALLKRFRLFGPPGIILFDAQGRELGRVVGYQSPDLFLKSLDRAVGSQAALAS
jgi:thioredoxin:protein disulfide reductase